MAQQINSLSHIFGSRQKRVAVSSFRPKAHTFLDLVFLRCLGKRLLYIMPVLCVVIGCFSLLNSRIETQVEFVESQNYELLSRNLQLKSEVAAVSSLGHVELQAEAYGLFPQEKWQKRTI